MATVFSEEAVHILLDSVKVSMALHYFIVLSPAQDTTFQAIMIKYCITGQFFLKEHFKICVYSAVCFGFLLLCKARCSGPKVSRVHLKKVFFHSEIMEQFNFFCD